MQLAQHSRGSHSPATEQNGGVLSRDRVLELLERLCLRREERVISIPNERWPCVDDRHRRLLMRLVALRYPVPSSVGNRARYYVPAGSDLLLREMRKTAAAYGGVPTAAAEGGCSRAQRRRCRGCARRRC